MRITRTFLVAVLAASGLFSSVLNAAAVPLNYAWDTSGLTAPGTYSLDFQLTDGGDGPSNSATITNFGLGGGGLLPTQFYPPNGGFTDNLPTSLVLTDLEVFNSFTQDFTPGATLSFTLDLTNVGPFGAFPDEFTFAILFNGFEIPTDDAFGTNRLLRADLAGSAAGPDVTQSQIPAVPEPGTLMLLGTGLLSGMAAVRRRRTRRSTAER